MSYNNYNTRSSGRYNIPGRFVTGGELAPGGSVGMRPRPRGGYRNHGMNNQQQKQNQYQPNQQPKQPQQQQYQPPPQQQQQQQNPSPPLQQMQSPPAPSPQKPQQSPQQHQQTAQTLLLQNLDVEMKSDTLDVPKDSIEGRPHWMKSKLLGVKKISNKERRRRQNENLRRLLAPKNALMVLNEMLPGARDTAAQFRVEPTKFAPEPNSPNFCAELTVDGVTYRGYGDNKIAARNDAAEQAVRDLIIKRMAKVNSNEATGPAGEGGEGGEGGDGAGAEDEEAPLPMIQLASFALHKLFAEWECDGHRVPQLRPTSASSAASAAGDSHSEQSAGDGGGAGGKPPRALPPLAGSMHPCMLLTHMRPNLEYRELAVEGDRPQNMLFTIGVEVDGVTYVGKAMNKREARKRAARSACTTLFGVIFEENGASAPASVPAPAPAPAPVTASEDAPAAGEHDCGFRPQQQE